jgi:hypothetical protein
VADEAMAEENPERSWHFKQLRRSLQALAISGSGQRALFPDLVVKADELALDFDHWFTVVRSNYAGDLTQAQVNALAMIDRKLATISRDGAEFDVELWTDEALASSEHWADVRRLAASALEAFGWASDGTPVEIRA